MNGVRITEYPAAGMLQVSYPAPYPEYRGHRLTVWIETVEEAVDLRRKLQESEEKA